MQGVFARDNVNRMDRPVLARRVGWHDKDVRFRRAIERLHRRKFVTSAHALMWYADEGPSPPDIVLTERGLDYIHDHETELLARD